MNKYAVSMFCNILITVGASIKAIFFTDSSVEVVLWLIVLMLASVDFTLMSIHKTLTTRETKIDD